MLSTKNIHLFKYDFMTSKIFTFLLIAFIIPFADSVAQTNVPAKPEDVSPLLIGEKTPNQAIENISGQAIYTYDIFKAKPTVLIFYRGGWCPYCNVHLAELQQIEAEILAMGYQIVGISPDASSELKASVEKHTLKYDLYSDADLNLAKAFGLAFQAPTKYKEMLAKQSDNKNPGLLPVPAVFVIDQEGTIQFEFINPNYTVRMSGDMLKAVLKALKTS
mgnify:CR=1 FL=1